MLSERCKRRLIGVNDDLVSVVTMASEISPIRFIVTEGLRTPQRQAELLAKGASQTMNSKHITGRAVDIAAVIDGKVSWHYPHYITMSKAFKQAASELGVRLRWGGDWKTFKDGPHYELL